jgi:hypothetical protein
VRVVAVRIAFASIDKEQAGCAGVDEFLAAVLDRDGGDTGVRHQNDRQLRLLEGEMAGGEGASRRAPRASW